MKGTKLKLIGLMLIVFTLGACQQLSDKRTQYIRNRAQDYLKSSMIPPLRVPENLSHPYPTDNYPIPRNIPLASAVPPVSLVPPGFGQLL